MGAGDAPRPEAESAQACLLFGSWRGSLQASPMARAREIDARGKTVGAVGKCSACRLGDPYGALACSSQRLVGSPFDPS